MSLTAMLQKYSASNSRKNSTLHCVLRAKRLIYDPRHIAHFVSWEKKKIHLIAVLHCHEGSELLVLVHLPMDPYLLHGLYRKSTCWWPGKRHNCEWCFFWHTRTWNWGGTTLAEQRLSDVSWCLQSGHLIAHTDEPHTTVHGKGNFKKLSWLLKHFL